MKFKLHTAGHFYNKSDKTDLEQLGFTFRKTQISGRDYALNNVNDAYIELNNIDELMQFIKKWGRVVVDKDSIIIYDDYLE